ncbi:MAG: hypothetical protein JO057_25735 [Chloroflexi bacterium]|nr:hypothetical protein [Chloroflexota bacterium]
MELLVLVLAAIVLDVLALRYGVDSRNLDTRRREPYLVGGWFDANS